MKPNDEYEIVFEGNQKDYEYFLGDFKCIKVCYSLDKTDPAKESVLVSAHQYHEAIDKTAGLNLFYHSSSYSKCKLGGGNNFNSGRFLNYQSGFLDLDLIRAVNCDVTFQYYADISNSYNWKKDFIIELSKLIEFQHGREPNEEEGKLNRVLEKYIKPIFVSIPDAIAEAMSREDIDAEDLHGLMKVYSDTPLLKYLESRYFYYHPSRNELIFKDKESEEEFYSLTGAKAETAQNWKDRMIALLLYRAEWEQLLEHGSVSFDKNERGEALNYLFHLEPYLGSDVKFDFVECETYYSLAIHSDESDQVIKSYIKLNNEIKETIIGNLF